MASLVYRSAIQAADGRIFVIAKDESILKTPHAIVGSGFEGDVKACGGVGWDAIGGYEYAEEFFVFGERGQYAIFNKDGLRVEGRIDDQDEYLILTGAKQVAGKFFVYGMGDALYRQDGIDKWSVYNDGIDKEHFDTQCICASDEGQYFCVGSDGDIYELVGDSWVLMQSSTNLLLTSCEKGRGGNIFVCGEGGTLLEGNGDEWKDVAHSFESDNFWGIVSYKDSFYVASDTTIFEMEDGEGLSPVLGWYLPQYGIFASFLKVDDSLWVIAEKNIFKYKNGEWLVPED